MDRCVPAGSLVFIPCPLLSDYTKAIVGFRLNKLKSSIAYYDFKGSQYNSSQKLEAGLEEKGTKGRTAMHFNTSAPDRWAQFSLAGVTAEDSGLYQCIAKVFRPGPVKTHCDAPTVDLRLEGRC